MSIENRKVARKRIGVAIPVWIDCRDGSPLQPCAMADVSDTGAKLKLLDADMPLPPTFILRVSQRDLKGKPCSIRWRNGASVGVQFLMPSIAKRTYDFSHSQIDRALKRGSTE